MTITIDTDAIAQGVFERFEGEQLEAFKDNDAPQGWASTLVESIPNFEEAVYKGVLHLVEAQAFDIKGAKAEAVKRLLLNENENPLADSLEWLDSCSILTTRRAFEVAGGDREVVQLFADGTDAILEDCDFEHEYFPDKSKSWPEIPTIFVVERV